MYSDVSFSNSFPRLIKYVENFKNKLLHKPEDALQETEEMGDTGETVDNGGKGDTESLISDITSKTSSIADLRMKAKKHQEAMGIEERN